MTKANPRSWIKRRSTLIAFVIAVPIVGVAGYLAYFQHSANNQLRRAIEAADREDPNWRLADLLARRPAIADEENPAVRVGSAVSKFGGWLTSQSIHQAEGTEAQPRGNLLFQRVTTAPAAQALPPLIAASVKAELGALKPALAEARSLAEMGDGRYPLVYDPIFTNTLLPQIQASRHVARLLQLDAIDRSQDGDINGALDSCRAILGVSRSIGDEPFLISQLVRVAIDSVALAVIERVLAQGVASDAALEKVERALEREGKTKFFLNGIRGERAGTYDLFSKIRSGELSVSQLAGAGKPMVPGSLFQIGLFATYNQTVTLELQNRAIRIGLQPWEAQRPLWEQWDRDSKPEGGMSSLSGMVAKQMMPAIRATADADLRAHALLGCGQTLIACERFRIIHGHWPDQISELSPADRKRLPQDPYSGGAIKLARRADGLTVYVTGPDRTDNGGVLDPRGRPVPGMDLGYRLWNVSERHRLPRELPEDLFARPDP